MNVEQHSEMTCPACEFTGDFKRAVPRFWVANSWNWLLERNHARRTLVCPECGASVTSASGRWMPAIVMLLIYSGGMTGAVTVSMVFN
jgi:hypothetical protein